MALLQAALNGARDHPALPRTPEELAAEGRAAVDAGARVLHLHPYDDDGRETFAAEAIEAALAGARIRLEQVHHGEGIASWAVNRRGAARGHGIRTGLEDTPVLPDGRPAAGNAELVAAAAAILAEHAAT